VNAAHIPGERGIFQDTLPRQSYLAGQHLGVVHAVHHKPDPVAAAQDAGVAGSSCHSDHYFNSSSFDVPVKCVTK
jgi:hypothetical protein